MNHSLGIALIIGALTLSSVYIWNSEDFTKTQKTYLLLCIIFPPLQWISIPIILYYNKLQRDNTKEFKEVKKYNDSSENLFQLKEKGILSADEYKMKIEKLDSEKAERKIKCSKEYQQLKSLLETGILTKEEFELKTNLLQNLHENKAEIRSESDFNETIIEKTFIESNFVGTYSIGNKIYFFSYNNVLSTKDTNGKILEGNWFLTNNDELKIIINTDEVFFKDILFTENGFYLKYKNIKYLAENINA